MIVRYIILKLSPHIVNKVNKQQELKIIGDLNFKFKKKTGHPVLIS